MLWIVVGAVAAAVLGIEVRSWRRSSAAREDSAQAARHSPWPSMGTDRSTRPDRD